MSRISWARALTAAAATAALGVSVLTGPSAGATAAAPGDRTSPAEAARVDQFPTPKLGWQKCYRIAECATVELPLDYDDPTGPTVAVAVARVKAKDPSRKIGSLFLNPGGPGGSGVSIAIAASHIFSKPVLERFDVVGFDPRGTNLSQQVKCFTGPKQQARALRGLTARPFPYTKAEERAAVKSARAMGRACSTTGKPLSGSMSTAEVARDMDVLRRAVGDTKLTYLGFSYGSYLGQVYANMFPDRVRAVAIDGVLDPIAWTGTKETAGWPQTDRLKSADGAYRALVTQLRRCDEAGTPACVFAKGNPVEKYDVIAERLKKEPLEFDAGGGHSFTFGYPELVGLTLSTLYDSMGWTFLMPFLRELYVLTDPSSKAADRSASRSALGRALTDRLAAQAPAAAGTRYWNGFEAFATVLCTDGLNPQDAWTWPNAADKAERRAPYFGRLWLWASAQCARETWTVRDEDAYMGPFDRRTAAPVLVVGNYWDPATAYSGAVKAAELLPNSRLLSSDNWGHTAYGTSACATKAIEAYLLRQALPAEGTVCHAPQPFEPASQRSDAPTVERPVVVPPLPATWGQLGR